MPDFFPLQLLLATFAGWVNREQAQVVAYLVEENSVLKEQLRGRRLRLTDDQRRRLAAKGKVLGRRLMHQVAFGLWSARRWGYRLLFVSTCFYTVDNLRYVLDRTGMKAQIDRQLAAFSAVREVVDAELLMQVATLSATLGVTCWWGFTLYARTRRSYFSA